VQRSVAVQHAGKGEGIYRFCFPQKRDARPNTVYKRTNTLLHVRNMALTQTSDLGLIGIPLPQRRH
jgi:hypothetical protein